MATVAQTIIYGDATVFLMANYEANGALFGTKLVKPQSPQLVALITDALRWQDEQFPAIDGVGATGGLTMSFIGFNGDGLEVFCHVPGATAFSLGSYQKQNTDTDLTILAASIAAALNFPGFSFTSTNALVNIFAPATLGALINGGSNLSVVFTPTTTSPIVSLVDVQSITSNSAVGFGNVIAQGGITFFDNSGICISLNPNPTLADTVFSAGASGGGAYSCPLTGLASGTTYYIVAYTTYNTTTTIYSQQTTFTTL